MILNKNPQTSDDWILRGNPRSQDLDNRDFVQDRLNSKSVESSRIKKSQTTNGLGHDQHLHKESSGTRRNDRKKSQSIHGSLSEDRESFKLPNLKKDKGESHKKRNDQGGSGSKWEGLPGVKGSGRAEPESQIPRLPKTVQGRGTSQANGSNVDFINSSKFMDLGNYEDSQFQMTLENFARKSPPTKLVLDEQEKNGKRRIKLPVIQRAWGDDTGSVKTNKKKSVEEVWVPKIKQAGEKKVVDIDGNWINNNTPNTDFNPILRQFDINRINRFKAKNDPFLQKGIHSTKNASNPPSEYRPKESQKYDSKKVSNTISPIPSIRNINTNFPSNQNPTSNKIRPLSRTEQKRLGDSKDHLTEDVEEKTPSVSKSVNNQKKIIEKHPLGKERSPGFMELVYGDKNYLKKYIQGSKEGRQHYLEQVSKARKEEKLKEMKMKKLNEDRNNFFLDNNQFELSAIRRADQSPLPDLSVSVLPSTIFNFTLKSLTFPKLKPEPLENLNTIDIDEFREESDQDIKEILIKRKEREKKKGESVLNKYMMVQKILYLMDGGLIENINPNRRKSWTSISENPLNQLDPKKGNPGEIPKPKYSQRVLPSMEGSNLMGTIQHSRIDYKNMTTEDIVLHSNKNRAVSNEKVQLGNRVSKNIFYNEEDTISFNSEPANSVFDDMYAERMMVEIEQEMIQIKERKKQEKKAREAMESKLTTKKIESGKKKVEKATETDHFERNNRNETDKKDDHLWDGSIVVPGEANKTNGGTERQNSPILKKNEVEATHHNPQSFYPDWIPLMTDEYGNQWINDNISNEDITAVRKVIQGLGSSNHITRIEGLSVDVLSIEIAYFFKKNQIIEKRPDLIKSPNETAPPTPHSNHQKTSESTSVVVLKPSSQVPSLNLSQLNSITFVGTAKIEKKIISSKDMESNLSGETNEVLIEPFIEANNRGDNSLINQLNEQKVNTSIPISEDGRTVKTPTKRVEIKPPERIEESWEDKDEQEPEFAFGKLNKKLGSQTKVPEKIPSGKEIFFPIKQEKVDVVENGKETKNRNGQTAPHFKAVLDFPPSFSKTQGNHRAEKSRTGNSEFDTGFHNENPSSRRSIQMSLREVPQMSIARTESQFMTDPTDYSERKHNNEKRNPSSKIPSRSQDHRPLHSKPMERVSSFFPQTSKDYSSDEHQRISEQDEQEEYQEEYQSQVNQSVSQVPNSQKSNLLLGVRSPIRLKLSKNKYMKNRDNIHKRIPLQNNQEEIGYSGK